MVQAGWLERKELEISQKAGAYEYAAKVSGYIVTEEGLRQFQQYDKFRDALLRDLEFVAEGRRREEQLRHRLRVSERRQKRKREP